MTVPEVRRLLTRLIWTESQPPDFILYWSWWRRRHRVSDLSGSDPETQRQQLLAVGVALSHIYQDVSISGASGTNSRRGWHSLDSRLAQGDTLVVVSIDRIGRRWLDTMGNIHDLQRRGVGICSLADNEQS